MTTNREFVIDNEELIEDYRAFIDYINSFFGLKVSFPDERIISQVLTLHLKGTLDNRIFNLFRQLSEDWEVQFIDMLTGDALSNSDMSKLLNSTAYSGLKTQVESLVRAVYCGGTGLDPNFTIWDVGVSGDNSYTVISACGDYRIEQWHHEHNVSRLEIKDVITYDMSHLVGYIHKSFAYSAAPSRIGFNPTARTQVKTSKKKFFEELVKNYVGYKLSERKTDEQRFLNYVDILGSMMIVNPLDIEAKIQALDSFFELEVRRPLDKMSNFKNVASFSISGEEIIVNFGSFKSLERKTVSFEELELQAAEANGDYVPERLRKTRG